MSSIVFLIIGLVILMISVIVTNFVRMNHVFKILAIMIIMTIITLPFIAIYVLNNGNPYTKVLTSFYIPKVLEQLEYSEDEILKKESLKIFACPLFTVRD